MDAPQISRPSQQRLPHVIPQPDWRMSEMDPAGRAGEGPALFPSVLPRDGALLTQWTREDPRVVAVVDGTGVADLRTSPTVTYRR